MAFRASENFPDTGLVSSIYARGGEWHGYTWTDLTTYFATAPKSDLDLLLRIEADRMARLDLAPEVIDAERGAVLAEMHMYENDPSSMLVDALMFTSFLVHPYRNNTIGIESDIDAVTYDDVASFYAEHYHPGNAVLAVVGDFDSDAVAARVGELFGAIEGRPATPLPHTVEPVQTGERRVRVGGTIDTRQFAIGYRAPSSNHDDLPSFLVLQALLGASSGVSFLQNDWGTPVREDGLLAGVADGLATWYPPSAQAYIFMIGGQPLSGQSETEVEALIEERLAAAREAPAEAPLVAAAIDNVLDELVFDVETTEDAAHQLAYYESIGALEALLNLPAAVQAVTPAAVRRVAARYLSPEMRTVAWYGRTEVSAAPSAAADEQVRVPVGSPSPVDQRPAGAARLSRLGGGLPLIVQASDFSSTVELRAVVAGNRIDNDNFAADSPAPGYSSLTVRARADALAGALDEVAADLTGLSVASAGESSSADPDTRLEQSFAALMSHAGSPEPEPVLLSIAGDVDTAVALELAEARLGAVRPSTWSPQAAAVVEPGAWRVDLDAPVAQAALGYIASAPGTQSDDYLAWRILLYVLSHGYEGRLGVEAISRRGLAYYIDSRYRSDGVNGWVTLSVGVDPGKREALKALLLQELARLESVPPTAAEVAEAKAWLLGRAESAAQSNAELSRKNAIEWLLRGELPDIERLREQLQQVSVADVVAAASRFIDGKVIDVAWRGDTDR
jgi:zinc protease